MNIIQGKTEEQYIQGGIKKIKKRNYQIKMVWNKIGFVIFIYFLAMLLPKLHANIAKFDEVWRERAEKAEKAAIDAYEPNPEVLTRNFNEQVTK